MEDFYLLTVVTLDFTTSNKKLAYLCGLFAELLSTYITVHVGGYHMETSPHGIEASGQLIQDSTSVKRLRIGEHSNCQNQ